MAETLLYQGVAGNPVNGLRVRLGFNEETLAGTKTLTPQDAQFQVLDPDGAHRQINMPQESASQGLFFRFENLSGDKVLNIHDSAGDAFSPAIEVEAEEAGFVVCDGTTWTFCG